jgi:myo-inositol 2-dehydrogenase/D-chiro-inositol 1-dehydrogenase
VTIRVGVLGTGNIGTDHARRLYAQVSGARVGAVFDVDAARARDVAREVGAVAVDRATDLIDDSTVDAVVIASPGETHADLALACIAADKPVLCEKPLATTSDAALKVLGAEVAHGRRLIQVGFMRRYDPGYRVVKAAIDDGSVGEPLLVHCVHRNATVPETFTTDMSLTDALVHEIDASRWLLGQEITGTTVLATRQSPLAATHLRDPQLVVLETEAGVVVEVEIFANCRYGYDVRCEVVGATGTASLDAPSTGAVTREGHRTHAIAPDWRVRFGDAYRAELQEWVHSIEAGVPGGPSAWDGYAATVVAESCVASLADGTRTGVTLVDRPALYA